MKITKVKLSYTSLLALFTFDSLAENENIALTSLFEQANYWYERDHLDLAKESLEKVLLLDEGNKRAIYLMNLWGEKKYIKSQGFESQLDKVRKLAEKGDVKASIKEWNFILKDGQPPSDLAAEYYQLLASDDVYRDIGIKKLRELYKNAPFDTNIITALGESLTWRDSTRMEGVKLLADLPYKNSRVIKSLSDGKKWLHDSEVEAAYKALNKKETSKAKKLFEKLIAEYPNDSATIAGLGYTYMQQGNYIKAIDFFKKYIEIATIDRSKYDRDELNNVRFSTMFAGAQQALKEGNQSLALKRTDELLSDESFNNENRDTALLFKVKLLNALKRNNDVRDIISTFSSDLKNKAYVEINRSVSVSDRLRKKAAKASSENKLVEAESILREGMLSYPSDGWIRLDLAQLLIKQNKKPEAQLIMEKSWNSSAGSDELYAGAIYNTDIENWELVQRILDRIPMNMRGDLYNKLAKKSNFNLQLAKATELIKSNDLISAKAILIGLKASSPVDPIDTGNLANVFFDTGDSDTAVELVKNNMRLGVKGNVGDYSKQLNILIKTGYANEVMSFLDNKEVIERSTLEQINDYRVAVAIVSADLLRESGNVNQAYDVLEKFLRKNPENSELLLAKARLLHAVGQHPRAEVIYDSLLSNDGPAQSARLGAINVALSQQKLTKAKNLADGLPAQLKIDYVLAKARVERALGNTLNARKLLASASEQLRLNKNGLASIIESNESLEIDKVDNSIKSNVLLSSGDQLQSNTIREVSKLLLDLDRESASWIQGGVSVRGRMGESGLSQLTELKAPVTFSSPVSNGSRLNLSLTPVQLNSGTVATNASSRFGSNALSSHLPIHSSSSTMGGAGLEVAGDYKIGDFTFDLGTTPLGLPFNTLIGGIKWDIRIAQNLLLTFLGERRAVSDSLLSYIGALDERTGHRWGQVTKNGGTTQLSFDDSKIGVFANIGAHSWIGNEVAKNTSVSTNAGMYYRVIKTDEDEFRIGVNSSWSSFKRNLSYYSSGHGGYFSPQNYISFSFPLEYTKKFSNLSFGVGSELGYQLFVRNRSDYFPLNKEMQNQLIERSRQEEGILSFYEADSNSGVSVDLKANMKYDFNKKLSFKAELGYASFGEYNESQANLSVRYSF